MTLIGELRFTTAHLIIFIGYCSKECVWGGINKKVYRFFRFVEANQQKLKKE